MLNSLWIWLRILWVKDVLDWEQLFMSIFMVRLGEARRVDSIQIHLYRRIHLYLDDFAALGFFHMQSAYDRDDYVHIKWQNIIAGYEHNFMKYNSSVGSHFNGTYDYDSVMHYYAYQFSKTKQPTIVPLVKRRYAIQLQLI